MNVFKPKEFTRSIHEIDLKSLKDKGIMHLIVDLDETLRKRNDDYIPPSSIEWINKVKDAGFNLCVSSNSFFPWKFKKIREKLNIPCSAFTFKPFPFAYWKALKCLGSNKNNTAMIGDQLFTDIWGANFVGIYTIMVAPLTSDEKGVYRRLTRWVERLIYRPSRQI